MKLKVKEILEATSGVLLKGRQADWLGRISTDTRSIKKGETFLALKGERFNGHKFIQAAVRKEARGLIISKAPSPSRFPDSVTMIRVKDTEKALGDIAELWRKKFSARVVAITGSNGKTTTKEMTARAISGRFRTLRNEGNLNNLVGLPLSLFRLDNGCDAVVLEMGTNHPREIARLTEIAGPDVGLITNIGPVHLEGLKSISGVLAAKSEMIRGLSKESAFVLNLDEKGLCRNAKKFRGRIFGFSANINGGLRKGESLHIASLNAEVFQGRPRIVFRVQAKMNSKLKGRPVKVMLPGLGLHNAVNALAAMAAARALRVPLAEAAERISGFQALSGRGRVFRSRGRAIVIDDTYNANPVSMRMALENLGLWKKGATAVAALGEMMELGAKTQDEHRRLGRIAAETGVDYLFVRGKHADSVRLGAKGAGMNSSRAVVCRGNREMAERIKKISGPGVWVLVKGSRRMRMEEIVKELVRGGRRLI